jgi:sulfite exporter TauE/SafE
MVTKMASVDADSRVGRVETVLVLCLGIGAVGYGVGRSMDLVSDTLPGVVYLLAGALLMLWGISLVWRE